MSKLAASSLFSPFDAIHLKRWAALTMIVGLTAFSTLSEATPPAQSAATAVPVVSIDDPILDPKPSDACATPGGPFLDASRKTADGLRSYVFESTVDTYSAKKPIREAGTYYFKSVNLVRFENRSGDYRSGSVVVREKSGTVRAKGGLRLGFITMTVEPESRLISSANGVSCINAGFSHLLSTAGARLSRGTKCVMTPSAVSVGQRPGKFVIVELRQPSAGGEALLQRILFDPTSNLPSEWAIFKDSQALSNCQFRKVQLNPELKDELFDL